jgi:hypothetical protein
VLLEIAKEPHRGIATRIPALQEIRFIGVEQTVSVIAATFAPRKRGASEVALYRAQTHSEVLRNGRSRPPLTVQGPDLRMQCLPACLALHRALLYGPWNVMGWQGHSHRLIGQRHGLLAHQVIHGIESLPMREEHLVQGFPEILE